MAKLEDIFNRNQYNIKDIVGKSQSWFQKQSIALRGDAIQPLKLIKENPSQNRQGIVPGELYLFMYDAKHQDTLPYWDMFPLVFPFRKMRDGFIGLNLHYLPYKPRVQLLDRLLEFKSNSKMDEHTRLKYSWATINGASRFNLAKPCVHRYLSNHIQSPLRKIDAKDWATVMMLPVERFVGGSKSRIWTESMRKL